MSDEDEPVIDPDDVDTDPVDDPADDDTGDADQLGDAGKKALDAMKAKWRTARDELKALKAQQAADTKDDPDQDPAELRKQAQAEARAEVLRERALDKVETKAAKLFADPEDARALLASRVEDFVDDGQVDLDAINEALTDLLKKKPHLAAAKPARFQGGADGGARKGSKPDQLTRDDLKKMTPAQIVKAQDEGRLNDLLGVD
jgi:hypothetical protein